MGAAEVDGSTSRGGGDPLVIGLVNNMPDAALRTTEQQFRTLLFARPVDQPVRFRLFFLPEISRSDMARLHLMRDYEPISALWDSHVDGLIVTGSQPQALLLTDEPYWGTLTRLVDWAQGHTVSTIWSCLAAHAAVRYLDGIERHALGKKLSGVFDCAKVSNHPLLAGLPSHWRVPHSRFNGLPENLLSAMGYRLLSRSAEAGADVFVREQESLFVFLNGHPEYHADALFREYRRDVMRFLSGEQENFPELPSDYFGDETTKRLAAFRQRAVQHRNQDLAMELPACGVADERLPHAWHDVATLLFGNWLSYVMAHQRQAVPPLAYQSAATELGRGVNP